MTWFRVDDTIVFHRKTLIAKNDGMGAWVRLGAWSSAYLTEGHLTREAAEAIATPDQIERLLVAGFLERDGDGYVLHDFLDYNPTAAEVEAERTKKLNAKVDAGRLGGIASGIARRKLSQAEEAPSRSRSRSQTHKDPDPDLFGEAEGKPSGALTSRATELLHELNVARMRSIEGARKISPTARTLQHIVARLSEGATDDDVLHVIAVCAEEVRVNPAAEKWFNHETPFRPDNFHRKLSMTLRSAKRPPTPAPQAAPRGQLPAANTPPPVEQRRREFEEVMARQDEEHRARLASEGYTWNADGCLIDPEGFELDERGRRKASAS